GPLAARATRGTDPISFFMANNDSDALTTGVLLLTGGAAGYVVGSRVVARWLDGSEAQAAPLTPAASPIVSTSWPPLWSAPTPTATPPQTPASSAPPVQAASPTRPPASPAPHPSASAVPASSPSSPPTK